MKAVFEKAQALGDAILQSEEFQNMRHTEDAVRENAETSALIEKFAAHKNALEFLFQTDGPDATAVALHTESMQKLQERLNMMDDVIAMNKARKEFSQLVAQVNQVLSFMITGETEEGCGGSCDSCGGCGHVH